MRLEDALNAKGTHLPPFGRRKCRLQQIQVLLENESDTTSSVGQGKRRGRPPGSTAAKQIQVKQKPAKQARGMSEAGRASIAAAQKLRWAAKKKADAAAARTPRTKKAAAPAKKAAVPKKQATLKPSAAPAKKTAPRTVLPAPSAKKLIAPARKGIAKKPAMPAKPPAENKAVPNAAETNPGE